MTRTKAREGVYDVAVSSIGLEYVGGVGSWASGVLMDHVLELLDSITPEVQLLAKILPYLALHRTVGVVGHKQADARESEKLSVHY